MRSSDTLHALDQRCSALMNDEKVERGAVSVRYFADVCYAGQGYHLEVPFEPDAADPFGALTAAFYAAHDRTYGYAPQAPIRLVNLRSGPHRRRPREAAGRRLVAG